MTKTKDLSKFTFKTRREKFQPSKENTSLHKMYYMTESNYSLHYTTPQSELYTEKIIEMFVQANPRKLQLKRVGEYMQIE